MVKSEATSRTCNTLHGTWRRATQHNQRVEHGPHLRSVAMADRAEFTQSVRTDDAHHRYRVPISDGAVCIDQSVGQTVFVSIRRQAVQHCLDDPTKITSNEQLVVRCSQFIDHYQTTRQVSVRRTPTAPAIPTVIQLPSDWRSGLSTKAIRSYRPVTA